MSLNTSGAQSPRLKSRFLLLSLAAIVIFLILILRLWYLQVINNERYAALSERNRIRYVPVAAPRGAIYDRDGHLLVDTRPAFGVYVLRQEVDDRDALLDRLAPLLDVERQDLLRRWESGRRAPRFRPLPLAEDVGRDALEMIQENAVDLPGILADVRPVRAYPYAEMGAHLFGYLGEITEDELVGTNFPGYRQGDFVGKSGLEQTLESYLRGAAGERRVEVDVKGKELRLLQTSEAKPGNKVFLTIRQDVQQAAEEAFGDQAGAAVVLDVRTGEVLAMTSRPTFNPAIFARGITGREWIDLLQNSRHPLQNRVVKGQYPPGSTYKIVTALAALRAKVATPSTTVFCTGSFKLGSKEFRCWKKGGHGSVDLKKALKESCDVWFYRVGLDLGIDRLAQTSRDLGLGDPTGFVVEGERGGLIPDRAWKQRRLGERWYDGETVIAAIGQGYVLTTPLQLAVMTAAVANGGHIWKPKVVLRVEDLAGRLLHQPVPEKIKSSTFAAGDLRVVREAMEAVVQEQGGTAWSSRLPDLRVAGKTGTSQVARLSKEDRDRKRVLPYHLRDHGLYVAYAPAEDPQIAVAVVVEHGSSGSGAAAPIAKKILAAYFGIELPPGPVPVPVPVPALVPAPTPAPVSQGE
jgi:penicillin-binding protein 2